MVPFKPFVPGSEGGSPSQSESQLQDRVAGQDPSLLLGLLVCKRDGKTVFLAYMVLVRIKRVNLHKAVE